MNRNEALLGRLNDWRPPEGRQSVHVADETIGWGVTLTADRADQLGCLVWELALHKSSPAALPLQEWAAHVAKRATGLLETMKVVEIDPGRGEALLRSDSPAYRGEQVAYYEVMLGLAGSATLRRIMAPRNGSGKREQTAFPLTHEAIAKLAFDLTDAA